MVYLTGAWGWGRYAKHLNALEKIQGLIHYFLTFSTIPMTTTMALSRRYPVLPFELIEHALGYIYEYDDSDYDSVVGMIQRTLYNCMLTCRSLVPRSRYLLFLRLCISSHHAYISLSCRIQHFGPLIKGYTRELTVYDSDVSAKPHAQLFLHRFAHCLSRLEKLNILEAKWTKAGLHDSFFLSLSSCFHLT